jgi:hypothetical protein
LEEDTLDKQDGKGAFSTQKINVEAVLAIAKKTKGTQIQSAVEDIIPKTEGKRSVFPLFGHSAWIKAFIAELTLENISRT